MASRPLSRKAALAMGALAVYLNPKMAADAKVDLAAVLKGVTAKNWIEHKPKIKAALDTALVGKLAQDADIADVVDMLDQLDSVTDEVADPAGKDDDMTDATGMDDDPALLAKLKAAGLDDATCAKVMAAMKAPAAADDAAAKPGAAAVAQPAGQAPADGKPDVNKEPTVTKGAMDAAIAAAVTSATAATMARLNAIAEAKEAVRPYIGSIPVAMDSADEVFRLALDHFKSQGHQVDMTGVTPAVFGAVFRAIAPTIHAAADRPKPRGTGMAADAATMSGFKTRFPNIRPVRHV